jgi:hypothetical protein
VIIPSPLPDGGLAVPLRASFLVFKRLPLLGVATNNAAPRLELFENRIELRVITRQIRRYEDLEYVDARQALGRKISFFVGVDDSSLLPPTSAWNICSSSSCGFFNTAASTLQRGPDRSPPNG